MVGEYPFRLKDPPVAELVVGVQFDPAEALTAGHLGVFWRELGSEWADAQVKASPAIPPQIERFGAESAVPSFPALRLQLMSQPEMRLRILRSSKDRMVQVQNGSLYYNWLRREGAPYPSYRAVKEEFDRTCSCFCRFMEEERLGDFCPIQWELVYIDNVPRGSLWHTPADWPKLFRNWCVAPIEHAGVQMESLHAEWHYEIEPCIGRLHLELATGRTAGPPVREALILNTTARGPVQPGDKAALDQGLDRGHREMVATFQKLTSDFAQDCWGLNHA